MISVAFKYVPQTAAATFVLLHIMSDSSSLTVIWWCRCWAEANLQLGSQPRGHLYPHPGLGGLLPRHTDDWPGNILVQSWATSVNATTMRNRCTLSEKYSKFSRYSMKCNGKHDTTWNIPRSITFSPLHFMLYQGNRFPFGQCMASMRWHAKMQPKKLALVVKMTFCWIVATVVGRALLWI